MYASGRLLRETFGDTTIDFFYSNSGQPYALKHNGTTYYYITNLQGDVMSIVDGTGAVVAEYEYDPYGNIISATGELAEVNPLRYRGYVYDQETELYYLQSRYYDSTIGRFINADAYASTGQGILGNNMFAYCNNSPIIFVDPLGDERVVGFGFQLDFSTEHGTYGVEVIIYIDEKVVKNTTHDSTAEYVVVKYTYSGVSTSQYEMAITPLVAEMISQLDLEALNKRNVDEVLILLAGIITNYQMSGGVFAVFGDDSFTSANSYSEDFETWSFSVTGTHPNFSGGVFKSYSDSCDVYGFKVGCSLRPKVRFCPFDVQYSKTYYSDPSILFF